MKALLKKIWNKVKTIFSTVEKEAKEHLPGIIQVVTNIDKFVDSPGCDVITSLIPGTLDDTIQKLLEEYLPKLLDVLNKSKTIAEIEDKNERYKAIIKDIQFSPDPARDILLHGIAGKLIQVAINIPWGESVIVAQSVYDDPSLMQ